MQEAQDIFGLEFDLGDLDQYDDDDDEDDVLPEDEMDGEEEERRPRKKAKKKAGKKTIYDVCSCYIFVGIAWHDTSLFLEL